MDTGAIHTKVSFYNLDLQRLPELSHEKAFWFNAKPRIERKTLEDRTFQIQASGKPEGICLLIKKVGEESLFVFSDDSYEPGTVNIKFDEKMIIKDRSIIGNIELTMASHSPYSFWVKITNQGAETDPLFELIENPFFLNYEET